MDSLGFEAKYGSLRVGRNAPLRIHSHLVSSTEPSLVESRRRLYVPQYLTQCNHKCWMRSFYISDISTRRDKQVNGRPFLASKPQCSWEAFFVCVSARLHVRAWVCLCSPWCRPYRLSKHPPLSCAESTSVNKRSIPSSCLYDDTTSVCALALCRFQVHVYIILVHLCSSSIQSRHQQQVVLLV